VQVSPLLTLKIGPEIGTHFFDLIENVILKSLDHWDPNALEIIGKNFWFFRKCGQQRAKNLFFVRTRVPHIKRPAKIQKPFSDWRKNFKDRCLG